MRPTRPKIIIVITIFVVLLGLFAALSRHKNNGPQDNRFKPPASAVDVVTKYLRLRENSVGADQSSPDSWLMQIKPLVTAQWLTKLQPISNAPTGNVPRDYYTARSNGWIVKALVTDCIWDTKSVQPTISSGVIICKLSDQTVEKNSGSVVSASSIPFGWGHNGRQLPPAFNMVKQNGNWLIDSVSLSSAE